MSTPDLFADIDEALAAADRSLQRVAELGGGAPVADVPVSDAPVPDAPVSVARFVRPRLRLFAESVLIDDSGPGGDDFAETRVAVIALEFEYDGFTIRASDGRDRVFHGSQDGVVPYLRDLPRETEARYALESFGAIQIDLLEHYGTTPDSRADYLVHLQRDPHTQCAFTAYAIPQLRALGFSVEIDSGYPYQVVSSETPWYAAVEDDATRPDWFGLELGVQVDGHRINLLPILLDMLEGDEPLELSTLRGRAPRFVPLPDSERYVAVAPDQFATLLRVVSELYQGERCEDGTLAFPAARAMCLDALESSLGGGESGYCLDASERAQQRIRALRMEPEPLPTCHGGVRATLRSYQVEGVRWLQHLRAQSLGGVLADDMGLGKTLQTIAHVCLEVQAQRADVPCLVVAPTSLASNWQREFANFAPHVDLCVLHGPHRQQHQERARQAQVIVTTYPVLLRDAEYFEGLEFHLLVLDEAQTIKNARSRSHAAVKSLTARHRLCLSGTPIENNLGELWSLFDFLMPNLLGSEAQFRHFYRVPIEHNQDELRLSALREQVHPFILRRMKDEVAKELPPKTEVVRAVELQGKQRELYESIRVAAHAQVRSAIRKRGVSAATLPILDALMRLRQLCCDPRLVRGDAARFVRESAKYELLVSLLDKLLGEGRRVLIFSQFTSMLSLIGAGLTERGIAYALLTGATQNRDRPIAAFESGQVDVFLISLKAGGTGLNLVSADSVIHYDPWWNPAAQDQATDRAYRIGQKKPVFVYNLIAAGSVEERMLALQQRKRRLAQGVVGVGAGPAAPTLEEHEVEHLLSPLG